MELPGGNQRRFLDIVKEDMWLISRSTRYAEIEQSNPLRQDFSGKAKRTIRRSWSQRFHMKAAHLCFFLTLESNEDDDNTHLALPC